MVDARLRFAAPSALLSALILLGGTSPAHAADYTIDCNQTQGAPYIDYDADPAKFYGIWEYSYDGTQAQTITVNILNCGYHLVRDASGDVATGYKGQSANETYTVNLAVDGMADAWGYNIWDVPTMTNFIITWTNPAPTDGGGGDGGDGGGGTGGGDGDGGASNSGDGSTTQSLPETGVDAASAFFLGFSAMAAGLALSMVRRFRRAR